MSWRFEACGLGEKKKTFECITFWKRMLGATIWYCQTVNWLIHELFKKISIRSVEIMTLHCESFVFLRLLVSLITAAAGVPLHTALGLQGVHPISGPDVHLRRGLGKVVDTRGLHFPQRRGEGSTAAGQTRWLLPADCDSWQCRVAFNERVTQAFYHSERWNNKWPTEERRQRG